VFCVRLTADLRIVRKSQTDSFWIAACRSVHAQVLSPLSPIEQSTAERGGDGFATIRGAHSCKERGKMNFDLRLADTERAGYFVCRLSVRQQLERPALPRCNSQHWFLPFMAISSAHMRQSHVFPVLDEGRAPSRDLFGQ